MNQTQLDLLFIDTSNEKLLYLQDVSEYNPDVEVVSPLLQITPPNFSTTYTLIYPILSTIYINSNALGWTDATSFEFMPVLPDGLWKIRQSVHPNDCLYKDHYHFRIVNLKKKILCNVAGALENPGHNLNSHHDWHQDIFVLLQLLDSAKFMAECCGKYEEAATIYNQVEKGFKKYSCSTC